MKMWLTAERQPLLKGWSDEQKYIVRTESRTALLRIAPPNKAEQKRLEFENMSRAYALGLPMCEPMDFALTEEGACLLQSWIDGEDAEAVIPTLPEEEQYRYGLAAGEALRLIHSIPAPATVSDWEERFQRKIDRKIQMYVDCPLRYKNGGGEAFIAYLNDHRHLLKNRPQCWQHGDYHIGNMIIGRDSRLYVIDFNRSDFGDPWEEFNRIVWSAQAAPAFSSGMVDGYFDKTIPADFWALLALYIASNTLSSLPWAIPFGEKEIATMEKQAAQVLDWYNNMTTTIPSWYLGKK